MEKLVVLLGDAEPGRVPRARTDLREALLAKAPELAKAGARGLSIAVADLDDDDADAFPQLNPDGLLDACVSIWLDSVDDRARAEAALAPLAARHASYLVTESVPRSHSAAEGPRLPGVALVTAFPKPEALSDEEFYARWHGSHTPLSLEIHPLLAYVRNSVARTLTPDAPPYRAIVCEAVESAAVMRDPERFYGGPENQKRAVADLLSFVELPTLSTVLMSEYRIDP